jgi:hypothetical protein
LEHNFTVFAVFARELEPSRKTDIPPLIFQVSHWRSFLNDNGDGTYDVTGEYTLDESTPMSLAKIEDHPAYVTSTVAGGCSPMLKSPAPWLFSQCDSPPPFAIRNAETMSATTHGALPEVTSSETVAQSRGPISTEVSVPTHLAIPTAAAAPTTQTHHIDPESALAVAGHATVAPASKPHVVGYTPYTQAVSLDGKATRPEGSALAGATAQTPSQANPDASTASVASDLDGEQLMQQVSKVVESTKPISLRMYTKPYWGH